MKTRRYLVPLLLALCAALAGCATATQAAGTTEPQQEWPAARYVGPVAETVSYQDGRITLAPPRAGDPAADETVWRKAYDEQCASGEAICNRSLTPDIVYARATVTGYGEIQPDDSVKLFIEDRLVYVIRYNEADGQQCPNFGPPPEKGEERPLTYPCTTHSWVDAVTGEGLGTS